MVARTAARCAAAFNDGIKFQSLPELAAEARLPRSKTFEPPSFSKDGFDLSLASDGTCAVTDDVFCQDRYRPAGCEVSFCVNQRVTKNTIIKNGNVSECSA